MHSRARGIQVSRLGVVKQLRFKCRSLKSDFVRRALHTLPEPRLPPAILATLPTA